MLKGSLCTELYYAMLCRTPLYSTLLYSTLPYSALAHFTTIYESYPVLLYNKPDHAATKTSKHSEQLVCLCHLRLLLVLLALLRFLDLAHPVASPLGSEANLLPGPPKVPVSRALMVSLRGTWVSQSVLNETPPCLP